MKRLPLVALTALLGLLPAAGALAQNGASGRRPAPAVEPATAAVNPETAPRPTAHATRTAHPVTVDGRLDEPEWETADPMTDFVQQLPRTGYPATFRTVVRLLYDADHIWVGAINYDPEPSRAITVGLERDFVSGNSDIFGLTLDTFHDRRNAFLFLVNPKGAVRDEQTYNDSRTVVEAWEGVINVRTSQNDSSWIVEMEIPTRTLRFDASKGVQEWGLNLIRRVRRVNETSYWAPLERQYRVHRMSRAGTLTGLEGLRQGRNMQLKPYALTGSSRGAQVPASSAGSRAEAGLDFKYGVTPSLTLDLTYNTDFSQVEVDQEQVNLTRFSLFFPERREFFIENAGAVQFGDVVERNLRAGASLSDFTLFNSRRIGLTSDGRPIPIVAGGRLSGRVGNTEVGLVDMRTAADLGRPGEHFAVGRLRRNVLGNSDVGVMVLNRQAEDTGAFNTSFGIDANLRPLPNTVINSYVARSEGPGSASDGEAARVSVGYRDAFWDHSIMLKRVSDDFDPGLGFIRRRGMREGYLTLGAHPRPAVRGLQEINPYVEADYMTDRRSALQSRTITLGTEVFFSPDGQLSLEVADQFDRLEAPFTVFPGIAVPPGAYAYREGSIRYQSGQARTVYGSASVSGGGYYGGTRRTVAGGLTWRPRYDASLEATLQRNDVDVPAGSFVANVAGLRLRYARSTRLFGSAYLQYNTQTRSYVTSARVNYRWAPLSDVFLVYTDRRHTETHVLNERSLALKVTRMLAF